MTGEHGAYLDVRRYMSVLVKRRYLALSVALIVVSIFTWAGFLLPKTYEANSTVFIERSNVMDPLIRGVGVSGSVEERLKNLTNSIKSRNIVERVIKKLDIDAQMKSAEQYEALVGGIRKNLVVAVKGTGGTDLFTISYSGSDPEVVRDLVNAAVSEYIEENLKFRREDVFGAYEFIKSQLLEYKNRLEESDRAIREFRERNPHVIPQSDTALLAKVEAFQTARTEGEIKLKELTRKRDALKEQLAFEKEFTVAFVTRESSPQEARVNQLQNQLTLLMTRYTDNYPEVIRIKSEIAELKRQIARTKDSQSGVTSSETAAMNPIYQQLKEETAKTEAEMESLKGRIGELAHQQSEAQAVLGRMPKEQEEWTKLQRDRNVYQKIYDDLLLKLENARVSKDLERTDKTGSFRVVDPAVLPLSPVKPDRVKMILLGIVLGIASGVGVAFGLDYLYPTFKDEDSVAAKLKLPVLATIPSIITEADRMATKRLDRKVFAVAGAYFSLICVALIIEVLRKFVGVTIYTF